MPGEKTEKATPKRRKDERKKGNVVQSQDIVSAVVLLGIFGVLRATGPGILGYMANGMVRFLGRLDADVGGGGGMAQMYTTVFALAGSALLPFFLVYVGVSILGTMAQTRLLFVPSNIKPRFSQLNPVSGIKKVFSLKGLVEVLKSMLKITVLGVIIWIDVRGSLPAILTLYSSPASTSVAWVSNFILDMCFQTAAAYLAIGLADYLFQWWDYERRIKMSKEDIKEEFRQLEGSPETKGRIKGEQMKLARRRQLAAVPAADVVVRNPTHYAIALKYERGKTRAPMVVAKGQNNVALKIVEIAQESHVHVIENKPLAQALYKTVDVGEEIPEEFYKAVAEVLAYIYRLKQAGRS